MTTPAKSPWTSERIETLRRMWAEGNSAGIISHALTGRECYISRSAVCGKVHRLGLPRRKTTSPNRYIVQRGADRRKRAKRRWAKPDADKKRVFKNNYTSWSKLPGDGPTIVPLPPVDAWKPLPGISPVTLADLGLRDCRWPVEDGKKRYGADRLCCGAEAPLAEPYCEIHANQALPVARRRAA